MLPAEPDHEMSILLATLLLHLVAVSLGGSATDHHPKVDLIDCCQAHTTGRVCHHRQISTRDNRRSTCPQHYTQEGHSASDPRHQ